MSKIKQAVRAALYASGAFGAYHRWRNRQTLTTLMFHRVLPANSSEFAGAEREFTFTVEGFRRCLDFVQKHYHVVDLKAIEAARAGQHALPPNAALITFDDGWLDTMQFAFPELQRRGLPAVVFVATEVLSSDSLRWWQAGLVTVLGAPERARALASALGIDWPESGRRDGSFDRRMAAELAARPEAERMALLKSAGLEMGAEASRQMMRRGDLPKPGASPLQIGAHGHTHAPLTEAVDPVGELGRSHAAMREVAGDVPASMSFPHGAYDASLLEAAQRAGFDLLFTSDPVLTDCSRDARLPAVHGRLHVPENQWTCEAGVISFPRLSTFLFFRPKKFLAPAGQTS